MQSTGEIVQAFAAYGPRLNEMLSPPAISQ